MNVTYEQVWYNYNENMFLQAKTERATIAIGTKLSAFYV